MDTPWTRDSYQHSHTRHVVCSARELRGRGRASGTRAFTDEFYARTAVRARSGGTGAKALDGGRGSYHWPASPLELMTKSSAPLEPSRTYPAQQV